MSAALRIREHHLRAIEAGDYAQLPGPAYAIGFIRAYAGLLALDGEELVRRFKRETKGQHLAPDLDMPQPAREPKLSRGILLALAILGICGYGIWHYRLTEDSGRAERVPEVPLALMALPNDPRPTPTAMGANAVSRMTALSPAAGPARASDAGPSEAKVPLAATRTSAIASADPAASSEPVHIYGVTGNVPYRIALRATADAWIEVKDGETSIFHRLMQAGDEYRLPEKPGLVARIGNAKAIEVLVDGKPLSDSAQPSRGHRTVVNLEARELLARTTTP